MRASGHSRVTLAALGHVAAHNELSSLLNEQPDNLGANNVLKRLQNLKTGTSGELIINALEPGDAETEQLRHKQFASDRRQGEWFACSPELCRHAMRTWERNNLLPPEHQHRMLRLGDRVQIYRGIREVFGKAPDMINPSLNEKWSGSVVVDTLFTDLVKKGGFYEV